MLPKINEFTPEGWKMETPENRAAFQSASSLADACRDRQILEGRAVICDSSHNLVVDCGCMRGLIPREEGAIGMNDGSVRDIAVISRVNRPVCFLVTGFQKNEDGKTIALLY
ncbi:MAG: 30S ribosomal protein S1, partial [[Clostridium] leptum]